MSGATTTRFLYLDGSIEVAYLAKLPLNKVRLFGGNELCLH